MSDEGAEHSDASRFSQSTAYPPSTIATTSEVTEEETSLERGPEPSFVSWDDSMSDVSKHSMTPLEANEEGTEEGELAARCQLCNKATASAQGFLSMPCKHRYCLFCAPMITQEQRCLLCSTPRQSKPVLTSTPTSQLTPAPLTPTSAQDTSFPLDMGQPSHSHMASQAPAVKPAYSIWNPLTPSTPSNQRTDKFTLPQVLEGGSESVASGKAGPSHHFSMPPPLMAQPQDWRVPPVAEGHSNVQTLQRNTHECTMCDEDGAIATRRCLQCEETLCAECVAAHHRVRLTREHTLVNVEQFKGLAVQKEVASSSVYKVDNTDGERCRVHDAALLCKCTTCAGMGLCYVCVLEHAKHPLVPHGDLRSAVNLLTAGSKLDQKNVKDAMETVRRMSERIEASVQSVMRELRSTIHMHISALEERKRDLLQRVDTIRQSKMTVLKTQGERLAQRHTSLTDAIKASKVNTTPTCGEGSDANLRSAFDLLLAVHREETVQLMPNESDLLKFIAPDNSFMERLRNLGETDSGPCARTTHVIGENLKKAVKDKTVTTEVQTRDACGDATSLSGAELTASFTAPDGRPLHVHIAEQGGGVYALSYHPVEEGNHLLNIMIRGLSISGCPALVQVRKGRDYASLARRGPLFSFACEGSGDGEVCRPWGICCDNTGRIIVADRSNNRVQIFDKDGTFVMKFGSPGSRSGQFDRPAGIAVNSMNEIVVADKDNHRIQVFNGDGEFLLKFGERGRTPGMFNYPWGVAVNVHNQIAVSDTRNHRVQIFSPNGLYIRKCGFDSSLYYKNLDSPRGVCFLPDGHLVITDFNNHRLAVVSSQGPTEMKCYGTEGDGDGFYCRPQGVTIDAEGHILVCDSRNNRVQVLSAEDMRCIATFGGMPPMAERLSPPMDPVTLDRPTDICVSPEGVIYVVDFGSNRIRVY